MATIKFQKLKFILKELIPPVILEAYRSRNRAYSFSGNYKSWADARENSSGYDSDLILSKVKTSLLQVKEGRAAYERDSVVFNKLDYSFPLLAGLLSIAIENNNCLSVLDYGGSLGSSYYQNKRFLLKLKEFQWSIVEQKNFVSCGKELFEDEYLNFFNDIQSCAQSRNPNVILLSSVLQYLENPYGVLRELIDQNIEYIIVDRTPFIESNVDRLTVQRVSSRIYDSSYPAWFFSKPKFLNFFNKEYEIIFEFNSTDKANIPSQFKGFTLRKMAYVKAD
ncbi:MAG: methyltransferase, TIGR04325 family [Trichocoleus desertorum ATA4-8-CV12]|jgi:putative methyltransferase (TIGR04325 family)|nr:methyltransferase, TIGR04325 family [Trichocoleus desertorum ATA4-8-CV12]